MAKSKKQTRQERREAARRARIEAQRKRERARRIRRNVIVIVVVLGVVAAVAFLVVRNRQSAARLADAVIAAGASEIMEHDEEGSSHVEPPATVDYETDPPTSGNHYENVAGWGVYRETVQAETLVHNLEHGGVVIHYRPDDLTDEEIEMLEDFVEEDYPDTQDLQGGVILNPNPDIPEPVALAAWQHTQTMEEPNLVVIEHFISERCGEGPEKVPLSCS